MSPGGDPAFVSDAFRERTRDARFPWCDMCGEPAVFREGAGMLHSTDAHPYGLPERLDRSGHDVTMRQWGNDEPRPRAAGAQP